MGPSEQETRQEAEALAGRHIPDGLWSVMYARAKKKLRYIIDMFGDEGGARNEAGYLAQLVIEAIKAEGLRQYTMARYEQIKGMEAGTKTNPHGHTDIILPSARQSQDFFA